MKASTIAWHLARDNQIKLARFCEHNKIKSEAKLYTYNDGEHNYWQLTSFFDNGGYITAELLHGDTKGYSIADYYQVLDYKLGV